MAISPSHWSPRRSSEEFGRGDRGKFSKPIELLSSTTTATTSDRGDRQIHHEVARGGADADDVGMERLLQVPRRDSSRPASLALAARAVGKLPAGIQTVQDVTGCH